MQIYIVIRTDDERINESGAFAPVPMCLGVFTNIEDAIQVKNKKALELKEEYQNEFGDNYGCNEYNDQFYIEMVDVDYCMATRIKILEVNA